MCRNRSFFQELTMISPPVSKQIRCSSSSPVHSSLPRSCDAVFVSSASSNQSSSLLIGKLIAFFPCMDSS
uniref:Uncharacterized protein n=1 Tax=Manihot esculenta TaxID=3983 RepID=A0A251JCU1_MANES